MDGQAEWQVKIESNAKEIAADEIKRSNPIGNIQKQCAG